MHVLDPRVHTEYKNKGWTDLTTCELWQEDLSGLSVLMQTSDAERQSSRRCEVYSPLLQSTEIQWRRAFHQSPMPSESEPVYVEPLLGAQLDSSKVWLCKMARQDLKISPEAWVFTTRGQSTT